MATETTTEKDTPKTAYAAGKKKAAALGKVRAGELCPFENSRNDRRKVNHLRDCYFAGAYGDAMPPEPHWFKDAE